MSHSRSIPHRRPRWMLATLILSVAVTGLLAGHPAHAAWSHRTRLTRSPESDEYPRAAAIGCAVHVVWIDIDHRDLYYARSGDAGVTWSPPRRLTESSDPPVIDAEIAAAGRDVHVVWQSGAYDRATILHRRSTNQGRTWRVAGRVSSIGESAEQPTVAVDGADVFIGWIRTRRGRDTRPVKIFLSHSDDRGRSWSAPKRIDRRSLGLASPHLAAAAGKLHLFWGRRLIVDGAWMLQILTRTSTDAGRHWSPRVAAVDGDGWRIGSVAVEGDTVHLLWERTRYKLSHLEYQRSDDGGRTWSAPRTLDEGSAPSLAASADKVDAVWVRDWDGTGPLVFARSSDRGDSWPVLRRIGASARFPALARTGDGQECSGRDHLVFARRRTTPTQRHQEIFYRRNPG